MGGRNNRRKKEKNKKNERMEERKEERKEETERDEDTKGKFCLFVVSSFQIFPNPLNLSKNCLMKLR